MVTSPITQVQEQASDKPPLPRYAHCPWWKQAAHYVVDGCRLCSRDIPGLLVLVGLFVMPPLAAALVGSQPGLFAYWLATALPWITITLGNIAAVLAIEAISAGQQVRLLPILSASIRWLPRYLWTNAITTLLFWGVFTPLQWFIGQQASQWHWSWQLIPATLIPTVILLLPMLFWHVRLVFGTYATIIDDQPGIRSVITSIGIAHTRWKMVAAAFVGSVLVEAPIAAPIYFLILKNGNPLEVEGFTWMLVMAMRPLFIATLHLIYEDYRPVFALQQTRGRRFWL
ncbi:MAG TPA: hypothetical protein VFA41_15930 [Ktedonobacteraceae bacterium]|nr:hypothetical protein [Ktedonobacteraceae bacterium]